MKMTKNTITKISKKLFQSHTRSDTEIRDSQSISAVLHLENFASGEEGNPLPSLVIHTRPTILNGGASDANTSDLSEDVIIKDRDA